MSTLKKWAMGFAALFVMLTIVSTYVKDVAGLSIMAGLGLLIVGYLTGGGLTGYLSGITFKGEIMTSHYPKTMMKERYYSKLPFISVIMMITGVVAFCAGVLGYVLNSVLFPPF